MPATIEVACDNEDCELDMFKLHYTYDMPIETAIDEFVCPYCERSDELRELTV